MVTDGDQLKSETCLALDIVKDFIDRLGLVSIPPFPFPLGLIIRRTVHPVVRRERQLDAVGQHYGMHAHMRRGHAHAPTLMHQPGAAAWVPHMPRRLHSDRTMQPAGVPRWTWYGLGVWVV